MTKSADAFRTISEVAEWLGVQTHVLRFWESKFTQVKPVKRAGGRRYYRPADMLLLGGIRKLLHEDGLTIKGVQKILREEGMAHVADMSPPLDAETDAQLDADLTARMVEDVEQPPVEAEIVSFSTVPKSEPDNTLDETESAQTEAPAQPVAEQDDRTAHLPAFLRTPAQPQPTAEPDDHQELSYPPFVEDAPADDPATALDGTDDTPPVLAEEEPAALIEEPEATAPVETPPEPVDTHIEEQADAPTLFDQMPAEPDPVPQDNDVPREPTLNFAAEEESPGEEESVETPEPAAELVQEAAVEPADEPAAFEGLEEAQVETAPVAAPQEEVDAPAPADTGLPSFLADYAAPAEETIEPEPEPEEPARPVARVVDVPDDPDPATIPVAPSALSKAAGLTHLSDAQRDMIRPLLVQLTALRDQMANNRREPR
ncbi:MerR family transcriptional regulator [Tateyamaria sp. ANG-S1]|uniref:MerR family transcriptional regulator n=1 Tax=Tateyamaria sp. ANG-S1 TaxID=1577905 RepID=UPI00057E8235|nr:MerR family transcriptional regulator [Tateyamaria sp. ANG-S1]KIC48607.1 hypothetical protein RA29_12875 [Tateyamaria sp. ANG-S1]